MVYKTKRIAEASNGHEDPAESCNGGTGDANNLSANLKFDKLRSGTIDQDPPPQQGHSEVGGEDIHPSQAPPSKRPDTQKKRVFGATQEKNFRPDALPDDYEAQYPPDEPGHEMGPDARVWRVYLDEAELNDNDMVEGWKDGIDVLLVFAGLFSAVVTTFVVQTSQKLERDNSSISVSLLAEVVAIQRTVAAGGSVTNVPAADPGPTSPPSYTKADVWVNALWFTSLIFSLVTALSAVLIKQWIQHYVSFVSGTMQQRARIHQFRYTGLEKWGVRGIISVLPVLLYAALFLFILGLVIFLQALKTEIAIVVGVIGGIAFALYVLTNGLPLLFPQCPYYTPLLEPIRTGTYLGVFMYRQARFDITHRAIPRFLSYPAVAYLHNRFKTQTSRQDAEEEKKPPMDPPKFEPDMHKSSEYEAAVSDQDKITQGIITWLLTMSSNPSVKPIALQSISGLRPGFSRIPQLLGNETLFRAELEREHCHQKTVTRKLSTTDPAALIDSPLFYDAERIIRACLFIPDLEVSSWDESIVWKPDNWEEFDEAVTNLGDGVPPAFQQALATFRLDFIRRSKLDELRILPQISPLSSLSHKAKHSPALWHAWSHGLGNGLRNACWAPHSILETYTCFSHLFQEFLGPRSFPYNSLDTVLSFLCQISPPDLVEKYFEHSPEQSPFGSESEETACVKFCAMTLDGVIMEWNEDQRLERKPRTEIGALIDDVSRINILHAIRNSLLSDGHHAGDAVGNLLAILDEFTAHPRFTLSRFKSSTYKQIFAIYELAYLKSPNDTQGTSGLFSSCERIRTMLAVQDCVFGLWDALFEQNYPYKHCEDIPLQVVTVLEGQEVDDQMVQGVFDAFLQLDRTRKYLEEEFTTESPSSWPTTAQSIVRWTLDYCMAHSGTDHSRPSVDAIAASLVKRPGFLTFTCSPFLIGHSTSSTMNIAKSKESDVLLRLADYHKNKPEAVNAWHRFFYWIQNRSNEVYKDEEERIRKNWTREDFDKYGRMAEHVDKLARRFGFNDPEFKIPRFEERDIKKFLKKQKRTPDTPKPVTSPSTSKSWSSLFRKLLPGRGQSDVNAAGNVDLESNKNNQHS